MPRETLKEIYKDCPKPYATTDDFTSFIDYPEVPTTYERSPHYAFMVAVAQALDIPLEELSVSNIAVSPERGRQLLEATTKMVKKKYRGLSVKAIRNTVRLEDLDIGPAIIDGPDDRVYLRNGGRK